MVTTKLQVINSFTSWLIGKLDKLPFEGDIELLPEDRVMIGLQKPNRQPKSRRNVINTNTMKHRLWPNRVVHYAIGHKLGRNSIAFMCFFYIYLLLSSLFTTTTAPVSQRSRVRILLKPELFSGFSFAIA